MSNASLRLAFARGLRAPEVVRMLREPPGFPRPLPLVRFADKALHAFPTPLHAHASETAA
jgi:hypothetical protein